MEDPNATTFRRMGDILVVKQFITPEQLAEALVVQETTGGLLGEICVEMFGLDRFALADALSEQYEELQYGPPPAKRQGRGVPVRSAGPSPDVEELRVLLAEAEAGRARLAWRTDALERRLAALESLVKGAGEARDDSRSMSR